MDVADLIQAIRTVSRGGAPGATARPAARRPGRPGGGAPDHQQIAPRRPGSVYTFASEATRIRRCGSDSRWNLADVGFAISVATLMAQLGIFLTVGILDLPFAGPFILYPLIGAMIFPVGLLAAASFLRRPGAATLVAVLFTVVRLIHWYAAPFGARVLASVLMLDY